MMRKPYLFSQVYFWVVNLILPNKILTKAKHLNREKIDYYTEL